MWWTFWTLLPPRHLRFTGQMMQVNPCLSGTGRSKVKHSVNVLCVSKQANSDAHLPYYSTSASERRTPVQARSAHLSLFDSMFNDRLTKDSQMRAGVDFAKVAFHCICDASILMCIIWFFSQAIRTILESIFKEGIIEALLVFWVRHWDICKALKHFKTISQLNFCKNQWY